MYYTFIMSNFSYCPLVWHSYGEVNTKKIEKFQERALRFIYQDYNSSYDTLLGKSKLPSLKVRRLRAIALEAFKILNNQTPVYLSDILHINPIFILFGTQIQLKCLRRGPVHMVSDHSALLLLKYGIPCHKSSEKLHLRSNLGHKNSK